MTRSSDFNGLDRTNRDLELGVDGTRTQFVGARFATNVPRGATITDARLVFTVDEVSTGASQLEIPRRRRRQCPANSTWPRIESTDQKHDRRIGSLEPTGVVDGWEKAGWIKPRPTWHLFFRK